MWGCFVGREDRPQQVKSAWHLAAEFMSNFTLTVGLISITSPDLFHLLSGERQQLCCSGCYQHSQWVLSASHLLICSICFLVKGSSSVIQAVIQHCYSALLFRGNEPPLNLTGPYTLTIAQLNAALHYATNHSDQYSKPACRQG